MLVFGMQSLGKSLQRAKEVSRRGHREKYRSLMEAEHDASILLEEEMQREQRQKGAPLKSIWETNNLEEFLLIADAREKGYEATRDLRVVVDGTPHVVTNDKVLPMTDDRVDWLKLSELLTIPRRPKWSYDMPAAEVQALETSAFFDWRRRLARMEEEHKVVMTPYEKNLEVWRQLWRVVERADVVLMILDARNPLMFRCADFEAYVRASRNQAGKPKEIVFLLNKSDLLTESQRIAWSAYFTARRESFIFFSATQPTPEVKDTTSGDGNGLCGKDEENVSEDDNGENGDGHNGTNCAPVDDSEVSKLLRQRKEKRRHNKKSLRAPVEVANPYELLEERQKEKARRSQQKQQRRPTQPLTEDEKARDVRVAQLQPLQSWEVLDPVQLLDRLAVWRATCGIHDTETPLMVGLVGYPNVGKSSTINAIFGSKRVVVSATPGKTKHFQTLVIPNERRVVLCDCPGLVFPSFASTREKMVCDGILCTDTTTDAVSAVAVLCRRIPRLVLEKYFNVSLLAKDDVDESHSLVERFLNAVARRRGYMGAHDRPNKSRAARDVLKLYVDGALLYVEPPPGYTVPEGDAVEVRLNRARGEAKNNGVDADHDGSDNHELESEGWEDLGDAYDCDCGDDVWDDLDSAADIRALSDAGSAYGDDSDGHDDDHNASGAALVMFYARPKGTLGKLTLQEAFNADANATRIKVLCAAANTGRRKKRTNHQLDPVTDTFVNEDGEVELLVDDDDGIVELVPDASRQNGGGGQQRSKRQMRRELKRAGAGPMNPTARKMGVRGY